MSIMLLVSLLSLLLARMQDFFQNEYLPFYLASKKPARAGRRTNISEISSLTDLVSVELSCPILYGFAQLLQCNILVFSSILSPIIQQACHALYQLPQTNVAKQMSHDNFVKQWSPSKCICHTSTIKCSAPHCTAVFTQRWKVLGSQSLLTGGPHIWRGRDIVS